MPIQRVGGDRPVIIRSVGTTALLTPVLAQGGTGATGATGAQGIQGPPGPGTGAGAWVASTAYSTNQVVQAPDGSHIYRIAAGTSRPSFDATEAALWGAVLSKTGTIDATALAASTVALIAASGGVVYLESYPRTGGETDDSPRLGRALTDAASLGAKIVQFAAGTYQLATQVTVSADNITLRGAGKQATTLQVTANVIGLNVTGDYVSVESLKVDCTTTGRTVFPVRFTDCAFGAVRDCLLNGASGSRFAGVYFNDTGSASMGLIEDCTFNHACILVETWDVMIRGCYVWAMTCDYGIGIFEGAGNTSILDTSVVPPLAATGTGLAGIYVDGASGKSFGTRIMQVYLDGNPSLDTRMGIYLGDGTGATNIIGVVANKMDAEVIYIDSAFNVLIADYSGVGNNQQGTGVPEIFITETGAQTVEGVRIKGAQFLQTVAVTGTEGPAVEVDASVDPPQVSIEEFDIKQPGAGGGYSNPEIVADPSGGTSLAGRGTLTRYSARGSVAVANTDTAVFGLNLSSPYQLAYRPLASDIIFAFVGGDGGVVQSVEFVTDNQIHARFAAAVTAATVLHWRVDLRR